MSGRFGAVLTAMVTPFDAEGRLDLDGAATLARWLVAHGNDGLVVAGTTGEAPVLGDAEKADLWRAVSEAVTVPVIAGSGTNDTAHSIELTKTAEACGAAAILAVGPYYNRPSQAGLEAHFRAVAEATALPVVVYDIPVRTGRKVSSETLLRLVREVDNIVAVKDAAGDPAASARLIAQAPDGFELYSGDDALTLPLLAVGAVGAVGVASHWTGPQYAAMIAAFEAGDVRRAQQLNAELLQYFAFQASDAAPNPVPTKALLRELGLPAGHCRLPHVEPPELGLAARAREIIDALELSVA
ncbi:MAG: 4-hydroxy-tetrahydrodipicolinate synthase [Actinobacteria bacterium]|nr:4-hydroxy-tetrahydrodipicolinate synthase [Actinomycetota bacterium]MBW3651201.1 4-hydroxy-tetrahydrodipicolinate synthase [Actinomycetota bacterium]